jgi:hypothetical protein
MNRKMLIIIVLVIILIILATVLFFYFKPKTKPVQEPNPDVSGDMSYGKKYFWQMPGISFQYLNFAGWDVRKIEKINENKYNIDLNVPQSIDLYQPLTFIVEKQGAGDPGVQAKKNPNGVYYIYNIDPDKGARIFFYGPSPYGISISPSLYEGDGYSGELMVKEIIDSFKLVDEGTLNIKQGESATFKGLTITNKGGGHKILPDGSDQSFTNVVLKTNSKEDTIRFLDAEKDKNGIISYDYAELDGYLVFAQEVGWSGEYVKLLVKKQILPM